MTALQITILEKLHSLRNNSGEALSAGLSDAELEPFIESDPALSFNLTYGVPVFGSPDPTDGSFGTLYLGGVLTW